MSEASGPENGGNGLTEEDWKLLLGRIGDGRCLPFLGAGACYGTLPLGAELARDLAVRFKYPFSDNYDLIKVAQYGAVTSSDSNVPKEEVLARLKGKGPPDFREPDEPHAVLADLPLPLYLTTNYDGFMTRALEHRHKQPKREVCRWHELLKSEPSVFDASPPFKVHPATPVVFHVHGYDQGELAAQSLVLTEDDYLEFTANMARDPNLFPAAIRSALATHALLFIGYRLADWNLRVLLKGLPRGFQRLGVIVLLPPEEGEPKKLEQRTYLEKSFGAMSLKVYWGTARQFCKDLQRARGRLGIGW